MAIRNIRRQASNPGAYPGTPTSAPIYVDSDNNKLKFIPAGSGTTEVEIVDASSSQTLTNKTVKQTVTELTADGAITIASGIVTLNKAGVLATTLAAPTTADAGTRITIISLTDNAHTVTFPTNTLNDGTTGINELATFAAFAGASMTVVALGTSWYVESLNAVTPSSTA
jgi:hypothetical protein